MRAEDVEELGGILLTGGVAEVGLVSQLGASRARRRASEPVAEPEDGKASETGDNGEA